MNMPTPNFGRRKDDKGTEEQMTNNSLARLFSMEFIAWIVGVVFIGGMAYNSLAAGMNMNSDRMDKFEQKQQTIESSVVIIQRDTAVIKLEQEHLKEDIKDQHEDLKRILKILETHSGHTAD